MIGGGIFIRPIGGGNAFISAVVLVAGEYVVTFRRRRR